VEDAVVNPKGVTCGCPPPKLPAQQTYVASQQLPQRPDPKPQAAPKPQAPSSLQQPLAYSQHIVADAPFVFNADNMAPALTDRVMRLRVESKNTFVGFHPEVQPPSAPAKPERRGFWRRLGHALFG
jgi:hypothetical protein